MTDSTPRLALDIAGWAKGLPPGLGTSDLGRLAALDLDLLAGDLPLPVAVLKSSALDNNRAFMRRFLAASGARIAPHGKTTMAPALFQMQLDDGAWGITAATASQVLAFRRFGVQRIFLANELVGRASIDAVLAELAADPKFDFYCLIDSAASLSQLVERTRLARIGRPVNVLVELGSPGARTGVRSLAEATLLARAAKAAAPWVALRGVEAYEGVFASKTAAEDEAKIGELLGRVIALAGLARDEGLFAEGPIILSAGGSGFFDLVARQLGGEKEGVLVLLRSGCTITHDDLSYARAFDRLLARSPEVGQQGGVLLPALEVWGIVGSRPEPGLAYVNVGKRDISHDVDLPLPKLWARPGVDRGPQQLAAGHRVLRLNDQHAHIAVPPDSPLAVGDMVGFGISHPCTTFDKWQVLLLVDDSYRVTGAVRTYF